MLFPGGMLSYSFHNRFTFGKLRLPETSGAADGPGRLPTWVDKRHLKTISCLRTRPRRHSSLQGDRQRQRPADATCIRGLMSQLILDDSGQPINSRCSIDRAGVGWNIILESRGGARGSSNERNTDYSRGLALIVRRLAAVNALITDARVESERLIGRGLSESDRRLNSELLVYPLALDLDNEALITADLKRTQAGVGSIPSKGGHNNTRRLLLSIRIPEADFVELPFADYVTGAGDLDGISDAELAETVEASVDVRGVADARKWISATIVRRQGQLQFRSEVLRAYGGRCAVTDCDAEAALEAAHVVPYRGIETNVIANGLLFRSDIHKLFDRGLLGVDPRSWTTVLHRSLLSTEYGKLDGARFRLPEDRNDWPDGAPLTDHLATSGLRPRDMQALHLKSV
jgi:putative restriction endonuclease